MATPIPTPAPGAGVLDAGGLDRLRFAARENSPEAVKAAASQFEALFIENVMKSMRDAAPAEGLFDSEQGRTMQGMLDQQYARALASRGIGLADVLVRQLAPRGMPADTTDVGTISAIGIIGAADAAGAADSSVSAVNPVATDTATPDDAVRAARVSGARSNHTTHSTHSTHSVPSAPIVPSAPSTTSAPRASATIGPSHAVVAKKTASPAATADLASRPRSFTQRFTALAEAASQATGIPAKFMLAQAALESGWGRREIKHADGSHSHNVFGVKASKGWRGPVAEVMTTEYVGGVAQRRVEKFRAYGSYAEAFADYARLLTHSPRYKTVVASASDAVGFAQGLQRAGYATDPLYADKLRRMIARV